MARKIDEIIAEVTRKACAENGCESIPSELIAAATRAALEINPSDFNQFPKKWYPTISAKAAGAPQCKDGWESIWFESLVEILYQSGPDRLPILFELLDRDPEVYSSMVVVRLFRFAAAGVKKNIILNKVKNKLPVMKHQHGQQTVAEVMKWASYGDPRLSKFMKSLSKIRLLGIGNPTVGAEIQEWIESRSL